MLRVASAKAQTWLAYALTAMGLTTLGSLAVLGARAWAAVELVEKHERQLTNMEINNYLTCLMVQGVFAELPEDKRATVTALISQECRPPGGIK